VNGGGIVSHHSLSLCIFTFSQKSGGCRAPTRALFFPRVAGLLAGRMPGGPVGGIPRRLQPEGVADVGADGRPPHQRNLLRRSVSIFNVLVAAIALYPRFNPRMGRRARPRRWRARRKRRARGRDRNGGRAVETGRLRASLSLRPVGLHQVGFLITKLALSRSD
jgi:hypothetical protein